MISHIIWQILLPTCLPPEIQCDIIFISSSLKPLISSVVLKLLVRKMFRKIVLVVPLRGFIHGLKNSNQLQIPTNYLL